MKRLFIAILLSLIVIAALIAVKNEYARFLPSAGLGMSALVQRGHIDNLFIGASTFRKGLDIEVLEQMPQQSYILTYNGNQPVLMLMQLEYLLRNHVSIGHLYIDFYPYTVAQTPSLSDTRLLADTDTQFKFELSRQLSQTPNQSISDRLTQLYELFVSANNTSLLWYPIYRKVNLSRNRNGGLLHMANQTGSTKEHLDQLPHFGKRDGLQPQQMEALARIIELCKQNQIQLHFLEIPKYHLLLQDPDYIEYANTIASFIVDTAKDDIVIRADQVAPDTTNPAFFSDLVHMSGMGAHAFTQALAKKIGSI